MVTYLAGCGLQSCPMLLAKGYPDVGWNPIEGERYLSFLRFAVFVNSESQFPMPLRPRMAQSQSVLGQGNSLHCFLSINTVDCIGRWQLIEKPLGQSG